MAYEEALRIEASVDAATDRDDATKGRILESPRTTRARRMRRGRIMAALHSARARTHEPIVSLIHDRPGTAVPGFGVRAARREPQRHPNGPSRKVKAENSSPVAACCHAPPDQA